MALSDKPTILIVDDTPDNIDVLSGVLASEYRIKAALNGEIALKIANAAVGPDLILLDIMMPGIDGYEVCRRLKSNVVTRHIPVIFVTAKTEVTDEQRGFDLGAVDYITKPISAPLVLARVKAQLALADRALQLESLVAERTRELEETRIEIIRRLGRAAEFKDNQTGLHVLRMSLFSQLLAERVGQPKEWCDLLLNAAPMHDVGKIGIPDRILLKPGRLDDDEWEVMKKHVDYGAEIIGNHPSPLLQMAREVCLYHHEKWDGTGYPHGLIGEQIPLSARIVAIADVFDALSSVRPYKPAWSEKDAVAALTQAAGTHFDPNLVPLFIELLAPIREIQSRYLDIA